MIVHRVQLTRYLPTFWRPSKTGRWTSETSPIIYTSDCAATCLLEIMMHTGGPMNELDLSEGTIDLKNRQVIQIEDHYELPDEWKSPPLVHGDYHTAPREIITHWVSQKTSIAINVPSATVNGSRNILIDPSHPDFKHLVFSDPKRLTLDRRFDHKR